MNDKEIVLSLSEHEIVNMMEDTAQAVAKHNADVLTNAVIAAHSSNELTNQVEFWKWMGRNYSGSGIFDTAASMKDYVRSGAGKEEWVIKQLQGKGYEWDWMSAQRASTKNMLNLYDAGDVANRAASDVTQRNIITGNSSEYQMKAYTSKTNPHLKNTPKDMTVITNAEKVEIVRRNGYENVEEFQDKNSIKKATNERLEQIKSGKVNTNYNFVNVAGTMAKAGILGCAIGIGTETIVLYKQWKSGKITDDEYLKSVLQSGGEAGVTSAATAGVMIPVSAAITAAGASTLLSIPVAFVIGGVINTIVAPCFERGAYREILAKAKYYQAIEDIYDDLLQSMEYASEQYYFFAEQMQKQGDLHQEIGKYSSELNKELKNLYESI